MTIDEIREARNKLAGEIETADAARLDEINAELDAISKEIETRKATENKRKELRGVVASGEGETVKEFTNMPENTVKTVEEIRKSAEYIDAFKKYIITGSDKECRALLSVNAQASEGNSNTVPVPTFIEGRVRAAWEKSDLLQYITRTYVRGNVGVGFEVSATDAAVHAEGAAAPAEEQLVLGVTNLVPQSIKKWIRISDEVLDLAGDEFLTYIYDELTAKIIKAAKAQVITAITEAPAATSASGIGVPTIAGTPTLDVIAKATALLSDDAENLCVVMNRATHPAFITAMASNGYMFDPFAGYNVVYDNTLPAFSAAASGKKWLIVGDLRGVQANFPNGDAVRIKYDDLTEAQADLVKIVGRLFVAIGITTPGRIAAVTK